MNFSEDQRAATVREFIETVWNQRRAERISQFVTEDYVDRTYQPSNAQGHVEMVNFLDGVMPDAHWTIDNLVVQDRVAVCELTLTGTHCGEFRGHPPKGNRLQVRAYRTFVFDDQRITEHAALLDTTSLVRQMDA